MSILAQVGDSGITKSITSGLATAGLFAAYVRFGMGRQDIFTQPMLKYYAVVGASSVASSFVWHQINTSPIEDQHLVYGLTGESCSARACMSTRTRTRALVACLHSKRTLPRRQE